MIELGDYLGLTLNTASSQWKLILDRSMLAKGERQDDYLPIETLLCFGLGLISTPSPSGNINIRESAPAVQALSALVKRTPKSLAAKLSNLNGRRPNSAKNERDLWIELTDDVVRFEHLYELIIRSGRAVGLGPERLPDFLEIETNTLQSVLDADRVTRDELRESVDDELQAWELSHPGDDLLETERILVGTARIGQKQFARGVLGNCGFSCVFCGLGVRSNGLPPARMLIASHIKPWRHSENSERVDSRNGLAACPTHDAAFDTFLITVSPQLSIVRSSNLRAAILADSVVARNFGPSGMFDTLTLGDRFVPPGVSYLTWHNDRFAQQLMGKVD